MGPNCWDPPVLASSPCIKGSYESVNDLMLMVTDCQSQPCRHRCGFVRSCHECCALYLDDASYDPDSFADPRVVNPALLHLPVQFIPLLHTPLALSATCRGTGPVDMCLSSCLSFCCHLNGFQTVSGEARDNYHPLTLRTPALIICDTVVPWAICNPAQATAPYQEFPQK